MEGTQTGRFAVRVHHTEGVYRITPHGELDLATKPILENALRRGEESRAPAVVVDLRQVTFMDAAGVHALLSACSRVRPDRVRLRIVGASRRIEELFLICGVAEKLPLNER
jgi:anti-anti-sigma factor